MIDHAAQSATDAIDGGLFGLSPGFSKYLVLGLLLGMLLRSLTRDRRTRITPREIIDRERNQAIENLGAARDLYEAGRARGRAEALEELEHGSEESSD